MTYKKDEALEALFKRYWKWVAKPENEKIKKRNAKIRDPLLHEPLREKRHGAQWYQIRDAVMTEVHDPTGQSDMTMAEAAALLSITTRQFKDIIRDGLIQEELLDGAGKKWTLEEAAELLNISIEDARRFKKQAERPWLFPRSAIRVGGAEERGRSRSDDPGPAKLPISASYVSEKEKARVAKYEKVERGAAIGSAENTEAKRRLKVLSDVAESINEGKKDTFPESLTGQKVRFLPAVLTKWATGHPSLKDWETLRADDFTIAVDPSLKTITRYIQVTIDGKLNVYMNGLNGAVESVDCRTHSGRLMREACKVAGYIELDRLGKPMKFETQTRTFSEAFDMQWKEQSLRQWWLDVYTGSLRHWSALSAAIEQEAEAIVQRCRSEAQVEGLAARERQRTHAREVKALSDAKQARELVNRVRQALLDVSLPAPAPDRARAPF